MSKSFGVAKGATASAVKVLTSSGSGSNAGVIAGVEFTCSDHSKRNAAKKSSSTANMSLGGGFSSALNKAVAAAVACGIPYAVAAGNEDMDACFSSPASEEAAVCVGSSDNKDKRSSFSNHGKVGAPSCPVGCSLRRVQRGPPPSSTQNQVLTQTPRLGRPSA